LTQLGSRLHARGIQGLALKVLAHRVGEDENDVLLLADLLGLSNATQVLEVASSVFGDRLDAAAQFFVEELFQSAK
jgi:hypothetical protein